MVMFIILIKYFLFLLLTFGSLEIKRVLGAKVFEVLHISTWFWALKSTLKVHRLQRTIE